jgi:hypothetical protein
MGQDVEGCVRASWVRQELSYLCSLNRWLVLISGGMPAVLTGVLWFLSRHYLTYRFLLSPFQFGIH